MEYSRKLETVRHASHFIIRKIFGWLCIKTWMIVVLWLCKCYGCLFFNQDNVIDESICFIGLCVNDIVTSICFWDTCLNNSFSICMPCKIPFFRLYLLCINIVHN